MDEPQDTAPEDWREGVHKARSALVRIIETIATLKAHEQDFTVSVMVLSSGTYSLQVGKASDGSSDEVIEWLRSMDDTLSTWFQDGAKPVEVGMSAGLEWRYMGVHTRVLVKREVFGVAPAPTVLDAVREAVA